MTHTIEELENQIQAQDCELEYWFQQAENYAVVQIPADVATCPVGSCLQKQAIGRNGSGFTSALNVRMRTMSKALEAAPFRYQLLLAISEVHSGNSAEGERIVDAVLLVLFAAPALRLPHTRRLTND